MIVFLKMGTLSRFQFRNEAFLSMIKKIKGLGGGGPWQAAQAIPPIDADIGQKDHFWMKTSYKILTGQIISIFPE